MNTKRYSRNDILSLNTKEEKIPGYAVDAADLPLAKVPISDLERLLISEPLTMPQNQTSPTHKNQQWKPHHLPPDDPDPPQFIPQQWQYKDPTGAVQGPFHATEMHEWYNHGFFTDTLPIKRISDLDYAPLRDLQSMYGPERPFMADVEASERAFIASVSVKASISGKRPILEKQRSGDWSASPEQQQQHQQPLYPFGSFAAGGAGQTVAFNVPPRPIFQQAPQPTPLAGGLGRGWGSSVFGSPADQPYVPQRAPVLQKAPYSPFKSPYGSPFVTPYSPQPTANAAASLFDSYSPSPRQPTSPSTGVSDSWPVGIPGNLEDSTIQPQSAPDQQWIDQQRPQQPHRPPPESQTTLSHEAPLSLAESADQSHNEITEKHLTASEKKKKKKQQRAEAAALEESRSKEEDFRQQQILAERKAANGGVNASTAEPSAPWAPSSAPKLSLKEIQAIEARKAAQRDLQRERTAAENLRLETLSLQVEAASSGIPGAAVWASRGTNAASIAEIMQQEESKKRIKGDAINAATKRYADSISPGMNHAPSSSDDAGWSRVPVGKPRAVESWNYVRKAKAIPVAIPTGPPPVRPTVVPRPQPAQPAPTPRAVDPHTAWCRQALSVIPSSTNAFKPSEFIEMLMSIDYNSNSSMIHTICDDTLGGYTAIDSRKFALEFIRRRQAVAEGGWQTVRETASGRDGRVSGGGGGGFETVNKFVVVGKKKKR